MYEELRSLGPRQRRRVEQRLTVLACATTRSMTAAALHLGPSCRTVRRRREPRACRGELLHVDGSPHAWFALAPAHRPTSITVPDDATSRLLYAQFRETETTVAIMTALWEVFTAYGLPMALSSDRAGWAFRTQTAKGPVDTTHLTHVGRALAADPSLVERVSACVDGARSEAERRYNVGYGSGARLESRLESRA